jgi:hypothetical protein
MQYNKIKKGIPQLCRNAKCGGETQKALTE